MSPFQSVARFGFLILFLTPFSFVAVEFLRRYEKSENGTKSPQMVRNVYGTKSLVPLSFMSLQAMSRLAALPCEISLQSLTIMRQVNSAHVTFILIPPSSGAA